VGSGRGISAQFTLVTCSGTNPHPLRARLAAPRLGPSILAAATGPAPALTESSARARGCFHTLSALETKGLSTSLGPGMVGKASPELRSMLESAGRHRNRTWQ